MFERFTEKAIKVIMLAQEEARRLGHNFVGTEQILLGLIGENTGIGPKVLKAMGVNIKDARVDNRHATKDGMHRQTTLGLSLYRTAAVLLPPPLQLIAA